MPEISFQVPLPPALVSQNGTVTRNVFARAGAAKKYREQGRFRTLQAMAAHVGLPKPLPGKVTVTHEWFYGLDPNEKLYREAKMPIPAKLRVVRPADEGNAIGCLKHILDGVVDAGLLVDDRRRFLTWGPNPIFHTTAKEHSGRSGVVLTFSWEEPG